MLDLAVPDIRVGGIERGEAAVTGIHAPPFLRSGAVGAAPFAIVLRSADVGGATGIDRAVIELRGEVTMVETGPIHGRGEGRAGGAIARGDGRQRVIGLPDAAVIGEEQRLVVGAV